MPVTEDLKLVFDVVKEAVARTLHIAAPTVDHRVYRAFNQLAKARGRLPEDDQSRFDLAFSEKLAKASPDWHFFDSAKPDTDDLDFNFAVYSSVRVAASKVLGECQLREHLKGLAGQN